LKIRVPVHAPSKSPRGRPAAGIAAAGSLAAALAILLSTAGCVPLLIGGAVGSAVVAADRRPVGIQIEDEAIERRVNRMVNDQFGALPVNVEVTSYNRRVLLTGEVPTAAARGDIERAVSGVENVKEVINELGVGQLSTLGSRTRDGVLTSKVKAALIDAGGVPAGAVNITTTREKVYLMGRLSAGEAAAAARAAARVDGVEQVIKVFEVLSDPEIRALNGGPQPAAK
jgi:osmotically-inducible protein OsmY